MAGSAIIPLCLSRKEGMIHLFVGSHVKKPESGLFSDWIGNNTNDLRCSDWPKFMERQHCHMSSDEYYMHSGHHYI